MLLDEFNIAKNAVEPVPRALVCEWVDDYYAKVSRLVQTRSRDFRKLHLCHCVKVGHRETDHHCEVSLRNRSHAAFPHTAQAGDSVEFLVRA